MLLLGDWQLHRAETGNALSWGYTFEWPVFAIFVVVFWGKTILDEGRHPGGRAAKKADGHDSAADPSADDDDLALPGTVHPGPSTGLPRTGDEAADDPELAAYNAYLARLNSKTSAHKPAAPETSVHRQATSQQTTTREEAGSAS